MFPTQSRSVHSQNILTYQYGDAAPLFTIAAILAFASAAGAQTAFTFTGAVSNLWNDPVTVAGLSTQPNWLPATVPPSSQ